MLAITTVQPATHKAPEHSTHQQLLLFAYIQIVDLNQNLSSNPAIDKDNSPSILDLLEAGSIDQLEDGSMDQLEAGSMDQQEAGSMDHLEAGFMDHLEAGSMDQLEAGSMDQLDAGSMDQLDAGSMDQRRAGVTGQQQKNEDFADQNFQMDDEIVATLRMSNLEETVGKNQELGTELAIDVSNTLTLTEKDLFKQIATEVRHLHFLDFENLTNFFTIKNEEDFFNDLDMESSLILLVINKTFDISKMEKENKNLIKICKLFVERAPSTCTNAADVSMFLTMNIDFFIHSNDTFFDSIKKSKCFHERKYFINQFPNNQTKLTDNQTESKLQYFDIDENVFLNIDHIILVDFENKKLFKDKKHFFDTEDYKKKLGAPCMEKFIILLVINANYDISDSEAENERYKKLKSKKQVVVLKAKVTLTDVFQFGVLEILQNLHSSLPIDVYVSILSDKLSNKKVNFSEYSGRDITKKGIKVIKKYDIEIYSDLKNRKHVFDPAAPVGKKLKDDILKDFSFTS